MRTRLLIAAAVAITCAAAPAAAGAGGPSAGVVQGGDGIAQGGVRYVALPAGQSTVVEAISRRTGSVLRWSVVPGSYGIPLVGLDGSTDGISHDGSTLVVGDTLQPGKTTSSFLVIGALRGELRATITLQGDFSFDALSPGARMLYLIQHVSPTDPSKYRVRAYDLGARRLLQRSVIDKTSWEEVMTGRPFTRVTSSSGRWVYTLYTGGAHPFVHALDTQSATARCIDLPKSWNQYDISNVRLRLAGGKLFVRDLAARRALAVVDLQSLRVVKLVRHP